MKKAFIFLILSTILLACNTSIKKEEKQPEKTIKNYPDALKKVFEKHGGIEAWKKQKTLSYKLKEEEHITDLHSRKIIVKAKNYALGFDGDEVWLSQKDSTAFTRNPEFYYNLFFYFYAMPFVLADDGIIYEDVAPLVYEGVSYPGIKISYKANVGTSPDDNYFIYYNPKTYKMEWLGYTVTFKSKKPSDKVKMIRYNDWEDVNGFLLPNSITWYKKDKEFGVLKPVEKKVEFTLPLLTKESMADDFYKNLNK